MPRIRTIKPETPHSESLSRCSRDARLCFVMMWTLADDAGRIRGASRLLASLLFPYDKDAPDLIDGWLDELERAGSVRRYVVDGKQYFDIPEWLTHQKIDRPTKSSLPEFREGSTKAREGPAKGREGSSGDRTVREGKGKDRTLPTQSAASRADKAKAKPNGHDYDAAFETLWTKWQPYGVAKGPKKEARDEWLRHAVKPNVDPKIVLEGAAAYLAECHRTETKTLHVCRFLKRHRWEDEYGGEIAASGVITHEQMEATKRRVLGNSGRDVTNIDGDHDPPEHSDDAEGEVIEHEGDDDEGLGDDAGRTGDGDAVNL